MSAEYSAAEESDWKYPEPDELVADGFMEVGEHKIYWHEYGNPNGQPVIFIHGGPGGGTTPKHARFFNPRRYRILLFDQRGCGKSTPSVADDRKNGLKDNSTDDLIADIQRLRAERDITGRAHIFGGSWGSTLSLAYAIKHPEDVKSLVLRGIFLCRRKDLDFLYQGNAATYSKDPFGENPPGAFLAFPEAWKAYVELIPEDERGDMVAAYAKLLSSSNAKRATKAAITWSDWEGETSYLAPKPGEPTGAAFARTFAGIENHYFMSGAFLEKDKKGAWKRDQNYIIENIGKITNGETDESKKLKVFIVQGQYDQVCPRFQADELAAAFKKANKVNLTYVLTTAGHSQTERQTAAALTQIMDGLSTPAAQRSL